jgi:DNA-binding GntR family transcriptional regulator
MSIFWLPSTWSSATFTPPLDSTPSAADGDGVHTQDVGDQTPIRTTEDRFLRFMVTSFRRGFDEFRHRKGRIRSAPRATVFVAITVSALLMPWCMRPIMACLVGACKERDPTLEIQKDSVRDQVRRTLTERILAGHYQPGDRLVELQIARELGTSQGSVREALRELEASRLVESEPRRGTRVRVLSLKELQDAYFARGILEQAAASTAAKAFKGNVEKLRQEVQGILDAAKARDLGAQAARVFALPRMIVEGSGNGVLLRLWESKAFETRARVRLESAISI